MDLRLAPFSIKRLIYLISVTIAAFVAHHFIQNPEAYWLIWSALTLSLIITDDTLSHRILIILITGLSAAAIVFLSGIFTYSNVLLPIYIFIITFICAYYSQHTEYIFPFFTVNLFAILSLDATPTFAENTDRVVFILLGLGIATIFQIYFWLYFIRNELRSNMMMTLQNLKQFNSEIFSCFLHPEYATNIYLFERRLHVQKDRITKSFNQLSKSIHLAEPKNHREKSVYATLFSKVNLLYDIMIDYSLLRLRVSDHTTFGICTQELSALEYEIDKAFTEAMGIFAHKEFHIKAELLPEKIKKFEETYQTVLQVTAREPLAFILFIYSLKEFNQEMAEFCKMGATVWRI